MSVDSLPIEGSCRCECVRFSVSAAPVITMACHCTGCQKMSSSAFSLSALIPASGFTVTQGCPVIGGMQGVDRHYFCPHCMSWLFTRPHGIDEFVNVRAALLDNASGYVPFMETWTREKLPWASTPAVESFAQLPEPQEFPRLMQAYAEFSRSTPANQ
ncbi:aldehyde-activating protein [Pseudomonas sp. C 49-2]|uniref:Aldehyde-activating protein n=1 Tax=Pseudomonas canadensis TaxID=915099 RepID=A0A423F2L5_9PSED|nr:MULTISPECIES: GFA family protein [Pseudomonas]ROM48547.1 aldehyde-activating protein [Pseudomonas canadensis]RTY00781.1 aldehyde-activating protein [Pseudomonas sp. C 49-2]